MSSGIDFFFVRPRYSGAVLADYSAYDGRNLSRARCSEQCVVLAASKATHIHQVHMQFVRLCSKFGHDVKWVWSTYCTFRTCWRHSARRRLLSATRRPHNLQADDTTSYMWQQCLWRGPKSRSRRRNQYHEVVWAGDGRKHAILAILKSNLR